MSSTEVSLDVDMLDSVPAKTMLRLIELAQNAQKHNLLFQTTVRSLAPLFRQFEVLDVTLTFDLGGGDITLSFTGDGERLRQVWSELRRNGYKCATHPKKGDTTFYGWWRQEGFSNLWMNFSSSVCRRVQIGTKMVEQPVYETQCGEGLPELEEIEAAPALPSPAPAIEDIPF